MVIRKKTSNNWPFFGVYIGDLAAADALITAISPQHREAQRPALMASGFRGQNPSVEEVKFGGSPVQSC